MQRSDLDLKPCMCIWWALAIPVLISTCEFSETDDVAIITEMRYAIAMTTLDGFYNYCCHGDIPIYWILSQQHSIHWNYMYVWCSSYMLVTHIIIREYSGDNYGGDILLQVGITSDRLLVASRVDSHHSYSSIFKYKHEICMYSCH